MQHATLINEENRTNSIRAGERARIFAKSNKNAKNRPEHPKSGPFYTHRIHVWYFHPYLPWKLTNVGEYTIHGSYGISRYLYLHVFFHLFPAPQIMVFAMERTVKEPWPQRVWMWVRYIPAIWMQVYRISMVMIISRIYILHIICIYLYTCNIHKYVY